MHIQLVSVTMRAHVVCRLNITVSLKVGGCFKYDFLNFIQHILSTSVCKLNNACTYSF